MSGAVLGFKNTSSTKNKRQKQKNIYSKLAYILLRRFRQFKKMNIKYYGEEERPEMWVRIAILNKEAWEGLSETVTFNQRLEGDMGMSHRITWGNGREVKEADTGGSLSSRKSLRWWETVGN